MYNAKEGIEMKKVIVTAADTSHGKSVARLAGLCGKHMPSFHCVIYDLGLTDEDVENIREANIWAKIKKYPYWLNPPFHNVKVEAGAYAWKPMCVYYETVQLELDDEPEFVFWSDAGCLLRNGLQKEFQHGRKHGVYTSGTRGIIREYTHPVALEKIGATAEEAAQDMRAATLIGFDTRRNDVKRLIEMWVRCAQQKDIMNPEGARKHPEKKGDKDPRLNHRHDQSALSCLLAMGNVQPIPPMGGRWGWVGQKDCDGRGKNIK